LGVDPRRSHIEDAQALLDRGRGEVRLDGVRTLVLREDSLVIAHTPDAPRRGQG
jgi:hypothetical protein